MCCENMSINCLLLRMLMSFKNITTHDYNQQITRQLCQVYWFQLFEITNMLLWCLQGYMNMLFKDYLTRTIIVSHCTVLFYVNCKYYWPSCCIASIITKYLTHLKKNIVRCRTITCLNVLFTTILPNLHTNTANHLFCHLWNCF